MKLRTVPLAAGATLILATATAACGADTDTEQASSDSAPMAVVVGFYPLEFLAERVGGDLVEVSNLAQPGAEPHDLELAPQQVQEVAEADLVLYMADFQPAVDDAVAQNAEETAFDALTATDLAEGYEELGHEEEEGEEHEESGLDPHVWLDPRKYAELATAVADRMGEADADNADTYSGNAESLVAELATLDEDFETGLAACERNEIVTTHNAFGYLAARYDLEQVGIAGLSPEDEPSPQELDEVRQFAEDNGVTTIFYEDAVTPEYAETVADQVGATTAVLSPLEVADEGEDYLSIMRDNLSTLEEALGCG